MSLLSESYRPDVSINAYNPLRAIKLILVSFFLVPIQIFNAIMGTYGDMIEIDIIVPANVTRIALQAEGSIPRLMLTTEVIISDKSAK
ncbi:MAG: hypothetical protein ACJAUP_000916 [Cellvibrionaceae bacterium]|jgi:hypothetical protein